LRSASSDLSSSLDRDGPRLGPALLVEVPGHDREVARAHPDDQEGVRRGPGRAGAEDGISLPEVLAHAVLVAVEDREHVVALERARKGQLLVEVPAVAV